MDTIERELEQAFLALPTLKYVGMALLQFICGISKTSAREDASGVFDLEFVCFSFPTGEERFEMHVNVEMKDIDAMDMSWLPLQADKGHPVCEIRRASQLGQVARYIRLAYDKYLTTRQTPSESPYLN
jgi:hypothetical protein